MEKSEPPISQTYLDVCRYRLHFKEDPAKLPDLVASVTAFVATLSSEYIWHKQRFNLSVNESPASRANASVRTGVWSSGAFEYLQGQTDVTDCVDDEWFIVWLLREISKVWQDVVISVEDSDGQFLLIEGAEQLPKWVTPLNATNRAFLYRGDLHLVPLQHVSALPYENLQRDQRDGSDPSFESDEGFLDLAEAISLVRNDGVASLAPSHLQDTVWSRISAYPEQIRKHHHKTLAYLPVDVALALQEDGSLISEAVAAFYEREPKTLKACNSMTRFPPASPASAYESSSEYSTSTQTSPGTVLVPVILTKPLYSQLVLQRFFPPKPFEKVSWLGAGVQGPEDERRRSVGMKITCGFEILYQSTSAQLRISPTDRVRDLSSDPQYKIFLDNLQKRDYFEGQIKGSKRWLEKERKVREIWLKNKASSSPQQKINKSFAQRVDEAVARVKASSTVALDWLPHRVTKIQSTEQALKLEDDERWLALDEQGLEEMLQARGPGANGVDDEEDDEEGLSDLDDGSESMEGMEDGIDPSKAPVKDGRIKDEGPEDRRAHKAAKKLHNMAEKVEQFVEGRGAVEGAEFSDEMSSDDDEDMDEYSRRPHQMSVEEREKRLADLVQPLSAEEWGSKGKLETASKSDSAFKKSAHPPPLPARAPKLTSNKYDGASSDESSEADEDDEGLQLDPSLKLDPSKEYDQGEDGPSYVARGEELDMHEEMDEFLSFAKDTLGLSQEQYDKILGERNERGAFVPGPPKPKTTNVIHHADEEHEDETGLMTIPDFEPAPSLKKEAPGPLRNPNLADFDALMEQMDAVLAKSKHPKAPKGPVSRSSTLPTGKSSTPQPYKKSHSASPYGEPAEAYHLDIDSEEEEEDDNDDQDSTMDSMDAELAGLFKSADRGGGGDGSPMDYNLVKNFLESFQNQGGFGGPAGNLAGRLGFPLPRDA